MYSTGDSMTMDALHMTGQIVPLTLRAVGEQVEILVDGIQVASVSRSAVRHWLARGIGSPRPLVDLPLRLSRAEFGVWLEVYHHVAPTFLEEYMVLQLRSVVTV